MRIGFLFNNRPYKLWHAAPIAFELSRIDPGTEIVILCADRAVLKMARHIATGYPGHRCRLEVARVPKPVRALRSLLRGAFSPLTDAVLRFNIEHIAACDALVVPDLTCVKLQQRVLPDVRTILTQHGAGDRAAGFNPRTAQADFVFVPGPKLERRYKSKRLIRDDGYAVVGYPKFDAVEKVAPETHPLFTNDRPVVLYNPHFEPSLSSWKTWGKEILDFFACHADRYNLIFAPHRKLFERWLRYGGRLPRRFRQCPNIYIDLGSPASEDMTYTRAADIYLGDVSSQVYEFLYQPRPCLFLDPRGVDWENDPSYVHWHLGPVLRDISELGPALARAADDHVRYKPIQERAFADTFNSYHIPSALQAARAIREYLGKEDIEKRYGNCCGSSAKSVGELRLR